MQPKATTSVTRVLSSFDDFPIHQTSQPVAQTAGTDLNHYDRYFFNGYTRDTRLFFALAMGSLLCWSTSRPWSSAVAPVLALVARAIAVTICRNYAK